MFILKNCGSICFPDTAQLLKGKWETLDAASVARMGTSLGKIKLKLKSGLRTLCNSEYRVKITVTVMNIVKNTIIIVHVQPFMEGIYLLSGATLCISLF